MATCRDIVKRSLRMTQVIGKRTEPSATELDDGMTVLQSLYDSWIAGGMFGRLADIYETGDYEASEGQRVFLDAGTVTLPDLIDGVRKPRDLSIIETFTDGGARAAYLWDRTAWVVVAGLEPDDKAPLANRGVNGLAACHAAYYAEEFGVPLTGAVMMQARTFKTGLSYKFGTERDAQPGTYF